MSSSSLSLGEIVYCSVKHKWQLDSEATIQVAGIPDIAQATSNLQQLELLTNRDIWTSRGHGLKLCIRILLNGEKVAGAPGAAEVVESLGVSLRDGELWSQLGIVATLSLPVSSEPTHLDQHGDIVLSLAHISPFGTAPGPSKGRKCRPADIRAAQPPAGVPAVSLDRINLTLNLTRRCWTQDVKALHSPEKSSLCCYPAINEHSSDLQRGDHVQPMDSHEALSSNDVDMDKRSLSQPPCTADDDMLDNFPPGISDQLMISRVGKDATNNFHSRFCGTGLAAGNSVGLESRHKLADVNFNHLLELTDSALRTLISVDPVRTSAGIRSLVASPGPKLAQISPALFSPGYLLIQAVSERTPFVSTIAYTMSSLSRRVLSSELRAKLVRLASLSPSPLVVAHDNSEQGMLGNDKIKEVIKARTWRMMQKTLFSPRAARRLKPIKANDDAIRLRSPDDMLDDNSMPSLQADFDSPLSHEELYNSFYTEQYSSHGDTDILENNNLDFDVLISAGGPEDLEDGDEDFLRHEFEYMEQEDEEAFSYQKDTNTLGHNALQPIIPWRVYANNESTGILSNSWAVDHPTINDNENENVNPRADGVGFTNQQGTHSSLRQSPPSGTCSTTPNDDPTFAYESVLGSQRSNDDEDNLFHSECIMELEESHFSLSNGGIRGEYYKSDDIDDEMIDV